MLEILSELKSAWGYQDKQALNSFSKKLFECLDNCENMVGLGAGRMGYSLRAFVMRLSHIGVESYFIGDTSLPRITAKSVVVINSSSGATPTMLLYCKQAKAAGATVFLITQNKDSEIASDSDHILVIPAYRSTQLMKTFPEQYTYILFDYLAKEYFESTGKCLSDVENNHSILE